MRMQRLGTRRERIVQRSQRLFDAVPVATHRDRLLHDGSQIGHQLVRIVRRRIVVIGPAASTVP